MTAKRIIVRMIVSANIIPTKISAARAKFRFVIFSWLTAHTIKSTSGTIQNVKIPVKNKRRKSSKILFTDNVGEYKLLSE